MAKKKRKKKKRRINFETLKFRVVKKLREDYVGDWYPRKNKIYVHRDLKGIDRTAVFVHEFVEMVATRIMGIPDCCSPHYQQGRHGKKNELAHTLGNKVEKVIVELAGHSWLAHQKRCRKVRNKIVREKIKKEKLDG